MKHPIMQPDARTPSDALAALFSRGELPVEIVVTGRWSPLSPVRVGERYAWQETAPGVGCYAPQGGGTTHIMAHVVRRNWGRFYQVIEAVERVA
jgi:hypothetical protein